MLKRLTDAEQEARCRHGRLSAALNAFNQARDQLKVEASQGRAAFDEGCAAITEANLPENPRVRQAGAILEDLEKVLLPAEEALQQLATPVVSEPDEPSQAA